MGCSNGSTHETNRPGIKNKESFKYDYYAAEMPEDVIDDKENVFYDEEYDYKDNEQFDPSKHKQIEEKFHRKYYEDITEKFSLTLEIYFFIKIVQ